MDFRSIELLISIGGLIVAIISLFKANNAVKIAKKIRSGRDTNIEIK